MIDGERDTGENNRDNRRKRDWRLGGKERLQIGESDVRTAEREAGD